MKKNNLFKKTCISYSFILLLITINLFSINLINIESKAEAHYLASFEEKNIGDTAVKKYENKNSTYIDSDIIKIQNDLIYYNSSKLNLFDNFKHKRYLEPVKVSEEKSINAYTFPGGQIFVTHQMMDFLKTEENTGYTDNKNQKSFDAQNLDNLYNASSMGFVIAHEMGHWENEDFLRQYDKQYNINMLFNLLVGCIMKLNS